VGLKKSITFAVPFEQRTEAKNFEERKFFFKKVCGLKKMITFALPNRKKRGENIKKTFFEILRHKNDSAYHKVENFEK
jgi:hypothetical protein